MNFIYNDYNDEESSNTVISSIFTKSSTSSKDAGEDNTTDVFQEAEREVQNISVGSNKYSYREKSPVNEIKSKDVISTVKDV
jgi:hypothetical protein